MLRECELSASYLFVKLLVIAPSEGKSSAKHGIEKDTRGPNISWRTMVLLFEHDFRAHIRRCTTENFKFDIGRITATETKIDQFNAALLSVDNYVFKFDVPMSDMSLVEIRQGDQYLLYNPFGFVFSESSLLLCLEMRMQTFTFCVLHH